MVALVLFPVICVSSRPHKSFETVYMCDVFLECYNQRHCPQKVNDTHTTCVVVSITDQYEDNHNKVFHNEYSLQIVIKSININK
jgi:hypothetical protein